MSSQDGLHGGEIVLARGDVGQDLLHLRRRRLLSLLEMLGCKVERERAGEKDRERDGHR